MSTISIGPFLLGPLRSAVPTNVVSESPTLGNNRSVDRHAHAWQVFLDDQLLDWAIDPSQLDEDGTITPSHETISLAIELVKEMSQRGFVAPTRIVPDAQGGIVFELQGPNRLETIHIQPDGGRVHRFFDCHRLVLNEPWDPMLTGSR